MTDAPTVSKYSIAAFKVDLASEDFNFADKATAYFTEPDDFNTFFSQIDPATGCNPFMLAIKMGKISVVSDLSVIFSKTTLTEPQIATILQTADINGCNALMLACDPTNSTLTGNTDILNPLFQTMNQLTESNNNKIFSKRNTYPADTLATIMGTDQTSNLSGLTALGMVCFFAANGSETYNTFISTLIQSLSYAHYTLIQQTLNTEVLKKCIESMQKKIDMNTAGQLISNLLANQVIQTQVQLDAFIASSSCNKKPSQSTGYIVNMVENKLAGPYIIGSLGLILGLISLGWMLYNKFLLHRYFVNSHTL